MEDKGNEVGHPHRTEEESKLELSNASWMEMEELEEQLMAFVDKESSNGVCCRIKRISGTRDGKLDGTYRLITERARNLPSICMNSCMYEKMGSGGRKFCFAYSTPSKAQCMNGGEGLPGQWNGPESWTRPDDWTKRPDGWTNKPDGWSRPDGMTKPDGWSRPNGMTKPEWTKKPGDGNERPTKPQ